MSRSPPCDSKGLYLLLLLILLFDIIIYLSLPDSKDMQGLERKGESDFFFTCPAPCISHREWPMGTPERSYCFCCPGDVCSVNFCFYQRDGHSQIQRPFLSWMKQSFPRQSSAKWWSGAFFTSEVSELPPKGHPHFLWKSTNHGFGKCISIWA